MIYIIFYILYMFIYISVEGNSAALGGRRRPRQDRGDAGGGKSGPCAQDRVSVLKETRLDADRGMR